MLESRAARKGSISFSNKLTENFLQNVKFSFINKRKVSYIVSGVLVVMSIISFCTLGLNKGIDFTGGRTYVVKFDQAANEDQLRSNLEAQFSQLKDAANTSFEVKRFGGEDQLRVVTQFEPTAEMIAEAKAQIGDEADANYIVANYIYEASKDLYTETIDREAFINPDNGKGITSSEQVGSAISGEMTLNSLIAVIISLVAIGLYIAVRFRRWQWALGATAALAHNALLVIGLFSMLYAVMPFNLEVNQAFIAAILTIIGYSINDTVVIFDRIREYIGLYPKRDIKSNIDNAICATLSRTINTSGTTLVTLLSIFIFGGETIRGFVFALILGVVIGTYSSVFIATPIAYDLQRKHAIKESNDAE